MGSDSASGGMSSPAGRRRKLSGWGRYPVIECRLEHLRDPEALPRLHGRNRGSIARGAGRAYGDAALNPELTLSTLAMDRIQAFDPDTGALACEAGALLADILDIFAPRGWFPPVVPGTRFVTVGGMIAADVHGKNHHHDGTFGAHVESLTLATADGSIRECSRSENADLFLATLGGMGLTGVILSARFRLRPVETSFITQETAVAHDLDELMALFDASRDWPYSVAWIDCLARGATLGRGLLTRGRFLDRGALPLPLAEQPMRPAPERRRRVPVDAPSALLNRFSIGLFNEFYHRSGRRRASAGAQPVHFDGFFFPLDRIEGWNRLYGRRGFVQYQCVLPGAESAAGVAALLERIAAAGQGSFLAVLKQFGPAGDGLMSFPMEGYTLALDFPLGAGALALLDELDDIVHRRGGRVYLAKDARCKAERIHEGYPRRDAFTAIRSDAAGAAPAFSSALSQRLAL